MIKRSISLLLFLVTGLLSYLQHSVSFVISSLPVKNPSNGGLFLAGSFNGWNPNDKNYHFQKTTFKTARQTLLSLSSCF